MNRRRALARGAAIGAGLGFAFGLALWHLPAPWDALALLAGLAAAAALAWRLAWAASRDASMPRGVHLLLDDGTTSLPLPVRYAGQADGMWTWVALAPEVLSGRTRGVRVAVLPGRTTLRVQFTPDVTAV